MRITTIGIAALALALVAGTTAGAVTIYGSPSPTPQTTTLYKASDLMGLSVQNTNGQQVGTVVDLVLDKSLNNVTHAVFTHRSQGQWMHYAIPFKDLSMSTDGNAIILPTTAVDLPNVAEADLRVSRVWFQGPIDVEWEPYAEKQIARGEPRMIDIYGRPIRGRARTPYVQNVYELQPGMRYSPEAYEFDRSEWRGYERDQYGQPLFERQSYVPKETFGHNGYTVEEQIYGRPLYRDLYRGDAYNPPSREDWRWAEGAYGRPKGYDRFGKPMGQEYGRYERPLYRSYEYDVYGRPLYRDTYQDQFYGKPKTGMGRWFQRDWQQDVGRLGLRRITTLMGTQVDVRDRDAGFIEDFAIDMGTGHVAYMIVSLTRDFAGAPNRLAAVPWQAVELFPQQNLATVDIDRSDLLDFAFREGQMPNLGQSDYARRLHQQFDVSPYWEVLGYVSPVTDVEMSGSAWEPNSWYAQEFDSEKIVTVSGTIESISSFKPSADSSAGLRLRIRTDDGRLLLVNAGPFNFANQKGMSFDAGERITITGSRVQIAGQNIILASQLKKDDKTVQLRTRQGRPLW